MPTRRIGDFMTRQPWSVQLDDSLAVARQMLVEREIHHLPVLEAGRVTGMLNARDVASAAQRIGATVEQVMSPAHLVTADAPLAGVLDEMAAKSLDAVVVVDEDGGVAGIFTASDAVRVLRDLVRRRAA
jgi:acetoin utilization protein AcuB